MLNIFKNALKNIKNIPKGIKIKKIPQNLWLRYNEVVETH